MRWLHTIVVPSVLFALPTLISLPAVSVQIAPGAERVGLWTLLPEGDLSGWQLSLWGFLTAAFVVNQWVFVARPIRRFQRWDALKAGHLAREIAPMIEGYRDDESVTIRVNVMLPSRQPLRKRLVPFYVSETMKHHGDSDFKPLVSQGVCGLAYRDREARWADLTVENPESFGLSPSQVETTREVQFVLSFPIRAVDPDTLQLTSTVLGVVNVDSREPGSERLVQDDEAREILIGKAQDLSELCSQIF